MMLTIRKYTLDRRGETAFAMPFLAEVLHFDIQDAGPVLWARIDLAESQTVTRRFVVCEDEQTLPRDRELEHVGTCLTGPLAWHCFEVL